MREKSWIILLFILSIFTGCRDEQYADTSASPDLISTHIQLSVDEVIPGYDREIAAQSDKCQYAELDFRLVKSRAVLSRRARIYQFDQSGALYYQSEPFSIDLTYGVPAVLHTKLRAGQNQNVWLFVANTTSQLPDLQFESQVENLTANYDDLLKNDELPFYASQQHVDIVSETQHTLKPFCLNRICSKLIIDYNIDPGSGFQLQELRIVNVSALAYYKQQTSPINTRFVSHSEYINAGKGSVSYFIPDNNQGVVPSIDVPEQKNIRNAPVGATYIELAGYYKTKKVIFRVYPGANATSDFNLLRNHWYRIYLNITDVYLDDLRVESSDAEEFVIYLYDEPSRDYSGVKNILLNNQLWINKFTITGSKIVMQYTSNPGSHLNQISFCDASGYELFGGRVNYYFTPYSRMHFSSMLEAQGNGSPSNPYLICDAEQLKNINKICRAGYQSRRYIQQDHIDLLHTDPNKWQPLGDENSPFQGVYDGNGYSVRNMTINTNATGNNSKLIPRAGLFGKIKDAVIRNLHIRDGYIGCKSTSQGSVAALAENSLIEECSTTLKIEQFQRANAGGIVGELINSELSYCYNACRKEMTAWNAATYYTGGIAGYALNSKIRNVYSIQALWIGNNYALGAVAGALVEGSTAENIFAELYKTSGDKIIGNPASTKGLMSGENLKKNEFTEYLNSLSGTPKWQYQSGNYPKLKGEK